VSNLSRYADERGLIQESTIDEQFDILANAADGNCLFLSVGQLDNTYRHEELRKAVCDFYKSFDRERDYPEDSLDGKIKLAYITDNIEYHHKTGKKLKVTHDKRICKNLEYAGIMDLLVICKLIGKNIVLMSYNENKYKFEVYEFSSDAETIFIKFNGIDHFEAMIPKTDEIIGTTTAISPRTSAIKRKPSPPKKSAAKTEKRTPSPPKKSAAKTEKRTPSPPKKSAAKTEKRTPSPTKKKTATKTQRPPPGDESYKWKGEGFESILDHEGDINGKRENMFFLIKYKDKGTTWHHFSFFGAKIRDEVDKYLKAFADSPRSTKVPTLNKKEKKIEDLLRELEQSNMTAAERRKKTAELDKLMSI